MHEFVCFNNTEREVGEEKRRGEMYDNIRCLGSNEQQNGQIVVEKT